MDPATATATELAAAIRDRRLSSSELLDHLLTRSARLNPELNAIVAWEHRSAAWRGSAGRR